jgi:hypothetical protein
VAGFRDETPQFLSFAGRVVSPKGGEVGCRDSLHFPGYFFHLFQYFSYLILQIVSSPAQRRFLHVDNLLKQEHDVSLPYIPSEGDFRMTRQELNHTDQTAPNNSIPRDFRLEKELRIYAMAAAAAGVGMMALTQTAEAKVIATKANIAVPINGGLIQFDINGDGIPDFGLSAVAGGSSGSGGFRQKGKPPLGGVSVGHLWAVPAQSANEICALGGSPFRPYAAALPGNIQIGAGRHFDKGELLMAGIIVTGCGGSSQAYGSWKGTHPSHVYMGVKFTDADGALHYGWVRISVTESLITHFNATIDGYGYETVPNKPIKTGAISGPVAEAMLPKASDQLALEAPKAASLGMLALGSSGLTAWRREEEALAA